MSNDMLEMVGIWASVIVFLLISPIAGWLAGRILKLRDLGAADYMFVGVLGSILGTVVFSVIGLWPISVVGNLVAATVGSILVLLFLRLAGRKLSRSAVNPSP